MSKYETFVLRRQRLLPEACGYEFAPWKRFRWLERLAKWVWRRLSRIQFTQRDAFVRLPLYEDRVIDAIRSAKHALDYIAYNQCRHVVMGQREAFGLEQELMEQSISMPVNIRIGVGTSAQVYGLTVHVIPWFEGILLLPDLKSYAKTP